MSFKLGKLQLLLGALGAGALFLQIVRTKKIAKETLPIVFIALITLGSLFLTLSYSKFFWDFFSEIMALFQFPWRFLAFAMFGTAVLAGYFFSVLRLPFQQVFVLGLILVLFVTGRKYFIKPMLPFAEYNQTYNSAEYLHRQIAYKMPEYVVQHTDYDYWHSLNVPLDKPFELGFDPKQPIEFVGSYTLHKISAYEKLLVTESAGEAHINLHYVPFWSIYSNGKKVTPQKFDKLARPVLTVAAGDQIQIKYQQTKIEKISNLLTVLGLVFVFTTLRKNKS